MATDDLQNALQLLAVDTRDQELSAAARQILASLRDGKTVESALAHGSTNVSSATRATLEAGILCGNPTAIFESFANQRMRSRLLRRNILATVAYPAIVLGLFAVIAVGFSVSVVPLFAELFEDFELGLPPVTEAVLRISRDLPFVLGSLALLFFVLLVASRFLALNVVHRIRGTWPLFGKLWMWSGQREFAVTLATLVEQRVPLDQSMRFAADMISDQNLAQASRTISDAAQRGQSLSDAMAKSVHFNRVLTALVRWGEQHDRLATGLRQADDFFAQRVEQQAALLRRTIPPVTLVFVALFLLTTVMAILLPLVQLIEALA